MVQTALITGGSSGIGLEIAKLLYQKGYNLILVGSNNDKLIKAKASHFDNQNEVLTICIDLSEPKSAENLYEQCALNNLSILVNNAGVSEFGEHVNISLAKIQNLLTLNIVTLTKLCSLFGADMKKNKTGYILNIASTASYQPVPYFSAYSSSKSYVLNFSEALSMELEDFGVSVTCLSPGHTDTSFFSRAGIGDETSGFFAKKNRISSEHVAKIGVEAMFARKLSVIVGAKNKALAFLNKITSRKIVAKISKKMLLNP